MVSRISNVAKAVVVLVAFLAVCDFSSADYKKSLGDWKTTAKYMKSEWKKTGQSMKQQYKDGDITKSYLYEMWKEYKPFFKGYYKDLKSMAKETKKAKTVLYDFDMGSSDMTEIAAFMGELTKMQNGKYPPYEPPTPPPVHPAPPVYHPPPTYPYYYPYHPPVPHPVPHPAPHPHPHPAPHPAPHPHHYVPVHKHYGK